MGPIETVMLTLSLVVNLGLSRPANGDDAVRSSMDWRLPVGLLGPISLPTHRTPTVDLSPRSLRQPPISQLRMSATRS